VFLQGRSGNRTGGDLRRGGSSTGSGIATESEMWSGSRLGWEGGSLRGTTEGVGWSGRGGRDRGAGMCGGHDGGGRRQARGGVHWLDLGRVFSGRRDGEGVRV